MSSQTRSSCLATTVRPSTMVVETRADTLGRRSLSLKQTLKSSWPRSTTLPPYAEFYPFRRDRCIYVNQASARTSQAEIAFPQGQLGYLYQADLQIESSEARCYGPEQGIGYQQNVAVPDWLYSPLLKNNGSFANGLDYLMLSGGYKDGYAQNSGLIVLNVVSNKKILNGHIPLCKKHIVGDIFVLDRFGNCEHSYSSNFSIPYSFLQGSLLGKDHCDRGSISDGVLTIGPEGRLFFPFIDLLPAKYGYLDVAVISISGSPSVAYVNSNGVARSWLCCIGANNVSICLLTSKARTM